MSRATPPGPPWTGSLSSWTSACTHDNYVLLSLTGGRCSAVNGSAPTWAGGFALRLQVGIEEGDDAAAGVLGRRVVVAAPRQLAQHHRQRRQVRWRMVVEEPMTRLRIHLDVVGHPIGLQGPLQPGRGPVAQRGAVLAAIAGHDRTRPGQQPLGVLGKAAIVATRGGEAAAGAHARA